MLKAFLFYESRKASNCSNKLTVLFTELNQDQMIMRWVILPGTLKLGYLCNKRPKKSIEGIACDTIHKYSSR